MQLEDVQAFFRTYYHPANASLALAGDIETDARVRSRRAATSATCRRARARARARPRPRSTREHRLVLEDRVELPRLYMAWHLAGDVRRRRRRDGSASATCWPTARRRGCIARSSTSGGSRSTSPRYQSSRELGSFFLLAATAAPGQSLTEIAARDRRRAAARWSTTGPTDARDGARRGAGRSALHLPPADRRRVRRQVRSAERLQRAARRSRVLRRGSRRATARDARERPGAAARGTCGFDRARRPERRAARPAGARAAGLRAGRRCRDARRSLAAAGRRPGPGRSRFPRIARHRWPTASRCAPSSTTACRSSRSCCRSRAGPAPIRRTRKGWPRSPPTWWTRAPAPQRHRRVRRAGADRRRLRRRRRRRRHVVHADDAGAVRRARRVAARRHR